MKAYSHTFNYMTCYTLSNIKVLVSMDYNFLFCVGIVIAFNWFYDCLPPRITSLIWVTIQIESINEPILVYNIFTQYVYKHKRNKCKIQDTNINIKDTNTKPLSTWLCKYCNYMDVSKLLIQVERFGTCRFHHCLPPHLNAHKIFLSLCCFCIHTNIS